MRAWWLVLLVLTGCGLSAYDPIGLEAIEDRADASSDAGNEPDAGDEPDAGATCDPVDCGPVGCCEQRCCEVVPSNAQHVGTFGDTGISVAIDGGQFTLPDDCHESSDLGQCTIVDRPGELSLCVCRTHSLTIRKQVTIRGPHPLVWLAKTNIDIEGTLTLANSGPGTRPPPAPATGRTGGVGGTLGGATEPPLPSPLLTPLVTGQEGQSACRAAGGAGGGGAQLVAGHALTITGSIVAAGQGGEGGVFEQGCGGGAGGGSGGAVLLEAPVVEIMGGVYAHGGGGGGGGGTNGNGSSGEAGKSVLKPATGGASGEGEKCLVGIGGTVEGGVGGDGATGGLPVTEGEAGSEVSCGTSTYWVAEGGDGGDVGLIRINTLNGLCSCVGATLSPTPGYGGIVVR